VTIILGNLINKLSTLFRKSHCVGKSGKSGKSFAIFAISASAFYHHFIDRLDKNFSYSLYISYSFLIHYRSYQPSSSFASCTKGAFSLAFFDFGLPPRTKKAVNRLVGYR
jgi:hypothetical protein